MNQNMGRRIDTNLELKINKVCFFFVKYLLIRCQDKNILLTETLYKKLLPSHAKKDFPHIQKRLLIYTKNYPHIQKVVLSYNNVHQHKKFRFKFFYFYCFIYEKSKCEIMFCFFFLKLLEHKKNFSLTYEEIFCSH